MEQKKRSQNQLNTYQGYFQQLWTAGVIKVQIEDREWVDDLRKYVHDNYRDMPTKKDVKDMARYLLKMMDIELPTRNPITSSNPNKNHFDRAYMEDLTHHISWLKEVLQYNDITPFNERDK